MISIENSLYLTGFYNWKVDQDLNILINRAPNDDNIFYLGISYNPSNSLIYVVAYGLNEIQVFNSDLTLICRFNTSPHTPHSIAISSEKLYVGTLGIIHLYENEFLVNISKIIIFFRSSNNN